MYALSFAELRNGGGFFQELGTGVDGWGAGDILGCNVSATDITLFDNYGGRPSSSPLSLHCLLAGFS